MDEKIKITFFVKQGLDKFINDIINWLSKEYDTKKVIVTDYKQIDEEMEWADICWFEWCDELVIYGSRKKPLNKKLICRIHSYEAFTSYPSLVRWENVDQTIFVAEHIRNTLLKQAPLLNREKTVVIPNGVNTDKFYYRKREGGFNIAYAGYINYKKGPMLLIQTIKRIVEMDNRYRLYIAGEFQDLRYIQYYKQMLQEMGLSKNLFFQGWQNDLNSFLEDKDYILSTSLLESQGMSIMEAMSKGIKPVIHNFVGAKEIYPEKYLWNTIDEAAQMVLSDEYNSEEYRKFVVDKYVQRDKIRIISKLILDVYGNR